MKQLSVEQMRRKKHIRNLKENINSVLENGFLTDESVEKLLSDRENLFWLYGLQYQDVSHINFSKLSKSVVNNLAFSSSTFFPDQNKLPPFFCPEQVLKKHNEIQCKKFDDENVCVAVIDNPSQFHIHQSFKNKNIEHIDFSNKNDEAHFHADGVLANFFRVANKAKVILYTTNWSNRPKCYLKALQDVLKRLDGGQKIFCVSISNQLISPSLQNTEIEQKLLKIVEKLKNHPSCPCLVLDSMVYHSANFQPVHLPILSEDKDDNFVSTFNTPNCLGVKSCRFTPEFGSDNGYFVERTGSVSWTIPVVAYFYSLCRKLDSGLSFEKFVKSCKKHCHKNKLGTNIVNFEKVVEDLKI